MKTNILVMIPVVTAMATIVFVKSCCSIARVTENNTIDKPEPIKKQNQQTIVIMPKITQKGIARKREKPPVNKRTTIPEIKIQEKSSIEREKVEKVEQEKAEQKKRAIIEERVKNVINL